MNRWSLGAIALVSVMSSPGLAQNGGDARLRAELAPLEFIAGRCFTGVFPGSETFDVHCFAPVFGGVFLRDVHAVPMGADTYRGETLYHWDAEDEVIRYRYYNTHGGTSDGTVRPAEDGALHFPDETYRSEDGDVRVFSTVWRPAGEGYTVTTSEVVDGEAQPGMVVAFEPISRAEAEALIVGGL